MYAEVWRTAISPYLFWLWLATAILNGTVASAQPRTMYKPRDIENARQNLERYQWAQEIVAGWKSNAAFAMKQDREFFEQFISDLSPGTWYGQNCPACVGKKSAMGEGWLWIWSIAHPEQITCKRCGTVYPNEKCPETGVLKCPRMGQEFTYYETPEERAHPDQRGKYALRWLDRPQMTSFSSLIRMWKNHWAWQQALTLAKLYAVTGEIAYAERAAWTVDRFARVYPNYLYHDYVGSYADWPPAEVAANFGQHRPAGRFPRDVIRNAYGWDQAREDGLRPEFHVADGGAVPDEDAAFALGRGGGAGRLEAHGGRDSGPLVHLTIAYDLIRDARYPDGRRVLDDEMERRILDDLIRAGAAAEMHIPSVGNQAGHSIAFKAAAGILLEQPEMFRHALDLLNRVFGECYHFDGFYCNTPGYTASNFARLGWVPDILWGYSDPPGYQPQEGPRLDNYNPFASGRLRLALMAMVRMMGPGYSRPVIGDTKPSSKGLSTDVSERLVARLDPSYAGLQEQIQGGSLSERGAEYALWYRPADLQVHRQGRADLALRTEWFPGWHVGVLRGARQARDSALYLVGNEQRWTLSGTGHRHRDILSISYYAFGEELASDRGYFSGSGQKTPDGRPGQLWTYSTKSHNLVVVDDEDQHTNPSGSNLELFGLSPGIEVVQASGFNVYPQCEQYRRTSCVVQAPDEQTYVVDFFRVTGGHSHQYTFHCNGSLAAVKPAQPTPQLIAPLTGRAHGYPWTPWSMWVSNTRVVTPEQPYTFTWQFRDVHLDLMLLNTSDTVKRIVIADAPGWRTHPESVSGRPPIQQILAENSATNPDETAATQYAAVIVPYQAAASPVVAARLLANGRASGAIAVEVKFAQRTDYIISTMDQQQRQYGPVSVAGQFAFVSVGPDGRAFQGYLLDGTSLGCGELQMRLPEPSTTLRVRSVSDRTYHLAEPLPPGLAVNGSYLLARGPEPRPGLVEQWVAAKIDPADVPRPQTGFEMEATTADSITVRDYPVFGCDEVTLLNSQWRRLER